MDSEDISKIIDYPTDKNGKIVTRRSGLTRMKPKLGAPPANQPGSVDWTMTYLFGSKDYAIDMVESLVAGQGEDADDRWVRFVLLYRQWEMQHKNGELEEMPTFNQVCHSLGFGTTEFLRDLQGGIQLMMQRVAQVKAALAVPRIMDKVNMRAMDPDTEVKEAELALKIAGVYNPGSGINVQINNQQNVLLKSEKEKLKTPLLQFRETTEVIDEEVRSSNEHIEADIQE